MTILGLLSAIPIPSPENTADYQTDCTFGGLFTGALTCIEFGNGFASGGIKVHVHIQPSCQENSDWEQRLERKTHDHTYDTKYGIDEGPIPRPKVQALD
jgi:hypothetical protein